MLRQPLPCSLLATSYPPTLHFTPKKTPPTEHIILCVTKIEAGPSDSTSHSQRHLVWQGPCCFSRPSRPAALFLGQQHHGQVQAKQKQGRFPARPHRQACEAAFGPRAGCAARVQHLTCHQGLAERAAQGSHSGRLCRVQHHPGHQVPQAPPARANRPHRPHPDPDRCRPREPCCRLGHIAGHCPAGGS